LIAAGHAMFRGGTVLMEGSAGMIELVVDQPANSPRGLAIIAHPQPLLGGSATHKVPQVLARALQEQGWLAVRPNFRGVGASEGVHDSGIGETEDVLVVVARLRAMHPALPLALVGFSFGAFVQSRAALELAQGNTPAQRVVLAGLPVGDVAGERHYATGKAVPETLIVHGENDERAPLGALLDWARPQSHPIVVVPGADHFFSGKLPILRALTVSHLAPSRAHID
jgi:alpha/beta superfamily hydrolase